MLRSTPFFNYIEMSFCTSLRLIDLGVLVRNKAGPTSLSLPFPSIMQSWLGKSTLNSRAMVVRGRYMHNRPVSNHCQLYRFLSVELAFNPVAHGTHWDWWVRKRGGQQ